MRKKFFSLALTGVLFVCGLSGCGDNSPDEKQTPEERNAGSENVSLTLWGAEEDAALLDELVESFIAEYGSEANFDITVEYQSEASCKDAVLEDIENGPDVFTFVDDQLRVLIAAGVLSPVENEGEIRQSNIEAACEAASVNGVMYAYPMTADNGYFLYYNKAYLTSEDVKTMDGILRVAEKNGKTFVMDWSSGWYLYSFFGETGMEVGLNDDGVSNYCSWNAVDTEITGVDVAKGMLAIAASGALDASGQFLAGVQEGTAIAGVSGVWDSNAIAEAWGEDYGATKLPTYTCAGKQVQMSSFAGYKMVGVNSYSEHISWAQKLAAWMTNEENQALRFTERGQGPSNINASLSEEVAASPAIQAILEQSEFSNLQRISGNYWTPTQTFGELMAAGNPEGRDLQEILDELVKGITSLY